MPESPYLDPNVAAVYSRLAAPAQFAEPARALVAALEPPPGALALDVGTGTGVVAAMLSDAVGRDGRVVGIDPSIEMLRLAGAIRLPVVAQVPGLPFGSSTFDLVTASFVLSHLRNYEQALEDMVRVCRPRGRVGITAWGTAPNPAGALWKNVAAAYIPADQLADAFREVIPSEEPLADPARLDRILRDGRLTAIRITRREYRVTIAASDYVKMKNATVEGTLLHRMLSREQWDAFTRDVTDAFCGGFGATVMYDRDFFVATGRLTASS